MLERFGSRAFVASIEDSLRRLRAAAEARAALTS